MLYMIKCLSVITSDIKVYRFLSCAYWKNSMQSLVLISYFKQRTSLGRETVLQILKEIFKFFILTMLPVLLCC